MNIKKEDVVGVFSRLQGGRNSVCLSDIYKVNETKPFSTGVDCIHISGKRLFSINPNIKTIKKVEATVFTEYVIVIPKQFKTKEEMETYATSLFKINNPNLNILRKPLQ